MDWIRSIDTAVFRFINGTLSNPLFGDDEWTGVMPFLSWNSMFLPAVILVAVAMLWKGGTRGRLFVGFMLLVVAIGDGVICNGLKDAFERPRPFMVLEDVNLLVGKGGSGSMPSSHTANWFSATVIAFLFYRSSLRFMLPIALAIGFSRIYLGVHYPSDVLVGAVLGLTYAFAIAWGMDALWRRAGRRWFPLWQARLPNLVPAFRKPESEGNVKEAVSPDGMDAHWRRLGYLVIVAVLLARWFYIGADKIDLSEDEAYQWVWSQHLALSYYSKPPLIAVTQFLGTSLWGVTEFGVRFFSPLIAAILSFLVFRFLAREVNVQAAFWMLFVVLATPLLAVGSVLMTIDPLNVLFWMAATISGWHAVNAPPGSKRHWLWMGLWMGLGFLSKYTALFQLLCWAVFFVLWKPARPHLRSSGPWLALAVNALCTLPVLIWNAAHDWITVTHLGERGGLDRTWEFQPNFIWDFLLAEAGLLNPVFFVAAIWASVAFWKRLPGRQLAVYLFSMGAPLFLFYLAYTLRSRVQPNWIAPAILPLFCLMAVYWNDRWQSGARVVRHWLVAGCAAGIALVILLHDTNLVGKIAGRPLPPDVDPLRRVRAWEETAESVETAREKLENTEGAPAFIIGGHYGLTGQLTFYIPGARRRVKTDPQVYFQTSDKPLNQFYFWETYTNRVGQNAIYVRKAKVAEPAPEVIRSQFESVTDLGIVTNFYRGRPFRTIQVFECRNLLPPP